ncbi:MAG: PPOX class F420-dependent oxidoreductase [Chloroflexota bacterium]
MPKMTQSEINEFLQQPLHAIVGTNPADGPPQLSPVWFIYEDETLYISLLHNSAKRRNLERDPRISVCIDGGRADVRYVTFYGTAQLFGPDTALQDEWRLRIIRQYNPTEEAALRYYDEIKDMPATLIVLKPDRVISDDFN